MVSHTVWRVNKANGHGELNRTACSERCLNQMNIWEAQFAASVFVIICASLLVSKTGYCVPLYKQIHSVCKFALRRMTKAWLKFTLLWENGPASSQPNTTPSWYTYIFFSLTNSVSVTNAEIDTGTDVW